MASTSLQGDRLQYLRKQMLSNAAILFPKAIRTHYNRHGGETIKPEDVFDIVTLESPVAATAVTGGNCRAVVVHGHFENRKVAAYGARKFTQDKALEDLSKVLAGYVAEWWRKVSLPHTLVCKEETDLGGVDGGLA